MIMKNKNMNGSIYLYTDNSFNHYVQGTNTIVYSLNKKLIQLYYLLIVHFCSDKLCSVSFPCKKSTTLLV